MLLSCRRKSRGSLQVPKAFLNHKTQVFLLHKPTQQESREPPGVHKNLTEPILPTAEALPRAITES